ncbi:MAG: histidine kinase [Duncaniella sp.]|nr:histidine kinase [Duncaniella sp.]
MISLTHNRRLESLIYLGLWLLVAALFLLGVMRSRSMEHLPAFDGSALLHTAWRIIPFFVLFAVNNWLLIPRLLFRNRIFTYFLMAVVTVFLIWSWQYSHFMSETSRMPVRLQLHPEPRHLIPLPLFLDLIFLLLIVGSNLAIALLFKRYDDLFERESLMKANAENRLNYLKAQINPHFYMNMLNNIHGMIEVDPEKAQDMVIDMSHLMRYTLYDSERERISLTSELEFLDNYLRLMRIRYPENKVSITHNFPESAQTSGVMIPPLLFIVFLENAFKHGISYREQSYVSISMEVTDEAVEFHCLNSCHPEDPSHVAGIGLQNVRQRLKLIYGDNYTLDINHSDSTYNVNLTIPIHETTDTHN